jgi:hypothetical protein
MIELDQDAHINCSHLYAVVSLNQTILSEVPGPSVYLNTLIKANVNVHRLVICTVFPPLLLSFEHPMIEGKSNTVLFLVYSIYRCYRRGILENAVIR